MRRVRNFNNRTASILVVSSAAFYAASFLFDFCGVLSFICFVPLFFQRFSSYAGAAGAGFVWGVVAYGLTLSALLEVIIRLGEKPLSSLYALGFLGYFVFFSMLWCALALFLKRLTGSWAAGWLASSFLYFAWVHNGFFYFLTGYWYGYPLACPLVPLMEISACLGLLPLVGGYGLLFALIGLQVGISHRKKLFIICGAFPFLGGFFISHQETVNEQQEQKIVIIASSFYENTPYERAHEVGKVLRETEHSHPLAQVFVLPESTFPFPLNRYQYAQELLSPVCAEKYVLVGSHYGAEEGEGKFSLYNSAYVLRAGRILYRYDKKLLLPFFEEQPSPSFFFHRIHSPFLVGKSAFDSQKKSPTRYTVPGVGSFSFRICSELLWDIPLHEQVVLLVNDSHYRYAYFSRLFKLFAQFQAVEKQSTLVYCGWKQKGRFDHSL